MARASGAVLAVNDRVDVALAAGLPTVHLAARSLSLTAARCVGAEGTRWGVSVHEPEEAAEAARLGADYLFFGAVYATRSHPGGVVRGLGALATAVGAAAPVPVVGIGGIGPREVAEVAHAGAYGVAVLGGVWRQPDPVTAVRGYLSRLVGP